MLSDNTLPGQHGLQGFVQRAASLSPLHYLLNILCDFFGVLSLIFQSFTIYFLYGAIKTKYKNIKSLQEQIV